MKNLIDNSTIAAIATPPGSGGIGIIRISGEKAFSIALKIFKPIKNSIDKSNLKNRYLYYGTIIDPENSVKIDEALVVFMKGPGSYTAEDVVEVQAHAGSYVQRKILSLIIENGARTAEPGEFTKRAFLNGRIGLTEAEAVMDIISSSTSASHKMAVTMSGGELGSKIKKIQDELIGAESKITACVDFPDDVDDLIDKDAFTSLFKEIKKELYKLKENHESGHQLREGLKIALIGPPNAGKSSILNRLISKERSIVTSVPGTTRDVIEESINLDGFPLVISDTAGIRETEDEVEKIGVFKTRETLSNSDLILFIVDAKKGFDDETCGMYQEVMELPHILVVNKNDIKTKNELNLKDIKKEPVYISALKNINMDLLKKEIFYFFENSFSSLDSNIIPNQRQYEIIEKILEFLGSIEKDINEFFDVELVSYDIRSCIDLCSELLGDEIFPDILDRVFSDFCIGK